LQRARFLSEHVLARLGDLDAISRDDCLKKMLTELGEISAEAPGFTEQLRGWPFVPTCVAHLQRTLPLRAVV
jgi:hypothetical protein